MSYSITVRGKTKHEAKQKALTALSLQFTTMKEHARDAAAAQASASAHVDAVDEPKEGNEVVVECNGYLTGNWELRGLSHVTGASHTVRVYHAHAPEALPA